MNIFVGNLAKQVKEDDLESLFKEYGTVVSVNIIRDMFSRESKGFGFVEMKERPAGTKAIEELNTKDVQGKKITVNEARPKTDNNRRGGRGRGGFSSGSGGGNRRY